MTPPSTPPSTPPPCLGDLLSGLVDGELDHDARERVLAHLTGCAGCRAEAEALRRLKQRLCDAAAPGPSAELTARLRSLAVPGTAPLAARAPVAVVGTTRPVAVGVGTRAVRSSRSTSGPGRRGPSGPPTARLARRRGAAAGCLLAAGLAAVLTFGTEPVRVAPAPSPARATVPVSSADAFVVQHVSTAGDRVPSGPRVRTASLTGP